MIEISSFFLADQTKKHKVNRLGTKIIESFCAKFIRGYIDCLSCFIGNVKTKKRMKYYFEREN